jgi:hypothetical protein
MPFKSTILSGQNMPTQFLLSFKALSIIVSAIILLALIHPASAFCASIAGTATYNGNGLKDVDLKISSMDLSVEVSTDNNGSYIFSNLPDGNYTITARKSPYAFSPLDVTISGGASQMNTNFFAAYQGCPVASLSGSAVSISAPSGLFTTTFMVSLSTSIFGAEIRYTLSDYTTDNSTANTQNPSSSSNLYSTALSISKTTRLTAAAFVNGHMQGYPSSAVYIQMDPSFPGMTNRLPVIILDSFGMTSISNGASYRNVAYLSFDVADATNGTTFSPTSLPTPSSASLMVAHNRGNSSALAQFLKRSYRLELRDETGEDRACPMLGMPEDSDWDILAIMPDKTLIHNNFAYNLSRDMGMASMRVKNVEVYVITGTTGLSSTAQYQGVYQIVESIKDTKNRLNLQQLHASAPEDLVTPNITGGYIFKFEWMTTTAPGIVNTGSWSYLYGVDPNDWPGMDVVATANPAYLTHPQYLWLKNYLIGFNATMTTVNSNNDYLNYIDERSFIDHIILDEFLRNADAYTKSQYFYKERDKSGEPGKIFSAPLWDYELTIGAGFTSNGVDSTLPTGNFQYNAMSNRFGPSSTANWFPFLFNILANKNSDFSKHFRSRWNELRQPGAPLSDAAMDARIDGLIVGLAPAASSNFTRWPILGTKTIPATGFFNTYVSTTWEEQIQYMRSWLKTRAAWLDEQWVP